MTNRNGKTCYACDQPATTREHVPPQSFFPEGHRINLITVPSCPAHNNANSLDVEYTRNVVCLALGVNEVGDKHFQNKAMRSLEHSPALLYASFSDIRPAMVQGETVGVFTTDVERVNAVMRGIFTALHFRETGEKIQLWEVLTPNLSLPQEGTTLEQVLAFRAVYSLISQMRFEIRPTTTPKVFHYAVAEIDGGRVYRMMFYDGYLVYGFMSESSTEPPQ